MVRNGATFGEVMERSDREGWWSVLAATPVKSVVKSQVKAKAVGSKSKGVDLEVSFRYILKDIIYSQ